MSDKPSYEELVGWTMVAEESPPPHQKYMVARDGAIHTAMPCYGMHDPWWVATALGGRKFEHEPIPMLPSDKWLPLLSRTKDNPNG